MRIQVASLPVEIVRAESARFRRPLLLLHGLWTGAWIWAPLAGYLAHRGWDSWAPSRLEAAARLPDHDAVAHALEEVAARLPAAPIIVAHDAAVVTAATLARTIGAPALVAIAPLVGPADGGRSGPLAGPRFWRARLGASRLPAPAGAAERALLGGAGASSAPLRADEGAIFRALMWGRARLPPAGEMPGLAIAGGADPLAGVETVAAIARRQGWEERSYPGKGHFPMLEPGWEQLADDLHRWIVRTMGADLLAFLDDEES